jgi:hypothetical protein
VKAFATPSTSVEVNTPLAVRTSSVSVNSTALVPLITAASFVPVMFTVMELSVPSAACTVNVSVAVSPAASWSCDEDAVYVHAPSAAITNLPKRSSMVSDLKGLPVSSTSIETRVPDLDRI